MHSLEAALRQEEVLKDTRFWEYCFPGLDFSLIKPTQNLSRANKAELFRRISVFLGGSQKHQANFRNRSQRHPVRRPHWDNGTLTENIKELLANDKIETTLAAVRYNFPEFDTLLVQDVVYMILLTTGRVELGGREAPHLRDMAACVALQERVVAFIAEKREQLGLSPLLINAPAPTNGIQTISWSINAQVKTI